MESCCRCFGPAAPSKFTFSNSMANAIGDRNVPARRRLYLGIVFPADVSVQPIHMYFSLADEGTKVLEAACAAAGLTLNKGKLVGSPERLNLFTLEGDMLRTDLDLEAHIPSTLQPNSWVILEKGNRVAADRLSEIRAAAVASLSSAPSCTLQ